MMKSYKSNLNMQLVLRTASWKNSIQSVVIVFAGSDEAANKLIGAFKGQRTFINTKECKDCRAHRSHANSILYSYQRL